MVTPMRFPWLLHQHTASGSNRFDIVLGVSEPTPIAVHAELEGLNDTTPGYR